MKEKKLLSFELVHQTKDAMMLIWKRGGATQDRQRRIEDLYRKDLDLYISSLVMLELSPRKELVGFGQRGKLSPMYIGPFEIFKKVGRVAYELALPPQLQHIHSVLYASLLK